MTLAPSRAFVFPLFFFYFFIFFFFFFLLQSLPAASSQPLHSDPIYSRSPSPSPGSHRLRRIVLGVLFGSLAGTSFTFLVVLSVRLCLLYANRTPILRGPVIFSPAISPKALQFALSDPGRLVPIPGSGPHGAYFRIVFDDGLVVAVKKLEPISSPGSAPLSSSAKRRLQRELGRLARVSHRNVMSLRAYVRDSGERFSLVYDYVPGGSLEDALKKLRTGELKLGWDSRHRIAIGVAKGLRHLHFECNPRILHYDLKPTNVLLDEEFEPKLGDCGLARLLGNGGAPSAQPASCYTAPECLQSCR